MQAMAVCALQTSTCGKPEKESTLFYSRNPFNLSWETKNPGCGLLRFWYARGGSLQRAHSKVGWHGFCNINDKMIFILTFFFINNKSLYRRENTFFQLCLQTPPHPNLHLLTLPYTLSTLSYKRFILPYTPQSALHSPHPALKSIALKP